MPTVTVTIPNEFLDLFQKRAFAHFATIMADGTPQITPVWVDYDAPYILVNSRMGRTKNANVLKRPAVALEISDPDNPYRYVMIRGTVIEIVTLTDTSHIDSLALRYIGLARYPWGAPDEVRQLFKIRPDHVVARVVVADPNNPLGH
ncbi:MAG: PPOX class F420-dependent oxidoreductase [Anaerolineales bacterium]|nr:PPOX class F420-dependent oxidoreductase [Anaerolineales bacterium]